MEKSPTQSSSVEAWARSTTAAVLARVHGFVAGAAAGDDQRRLLTLALEEHRAVRAGDGELIPAIHLPLLVHGAIADRPAPLDLAVACGFLELGADLLDHVAEDELGAHWNGVPRGLVGLIATGFVGAIPQLLLAELTAPAERKVALQRTMARTLFRIGAGQQVDLELAAGAHPELERVEAAVFGKTGERRALYAGLAGELAGAPADVRSLYETVARELSIARQIRSDCSDLFGGEPSRDLAAGARTWPIVWALSRLAETERARMQDALSACRRDPERHADVGSRMQATGVLRAAALRMQVSCQRASRALRRAAPQEPAATRLRAMIEQAGSLAPTG